MEDTSSSTFDRTNANFPGVPVQGVDPALIQSRLCGSCQRADLRPCKWDFLLGHLDNHVLDIVGDWATIARHMDHGCGG